MFDRFEAQFQFIQQIRHQVRMLEIAIWAIIIMEIIILFLCMMIYHNQRRR